MAAAGAVAGLERERLLSCTHSSITVCHFTYVTRFRSAPATVCEEIYTKNCNIVFTKVMGIIAQTLTLRPGNTMGFGKSRVTQTM